MVKNIKGVKILNNYLTYMYGVFFVYILIRIVVTIFYKISEKKYNINFYQVQTVLQAQYYKETSHLLRMDEIDYKAKQEQPLLFANQEKYLFRIRMLAKTDSIVKTFGSLIFCILSLLTIYFTERNINNLFTVIEIILLPTMVSLFNTFFEFFEIHMNVGYESPYPPK